MIVALLVGACSHDSQQVHETLRSWRKSLDLLEQQRTQHLVPETYVRQMLNAATKALDQQRKQSPDDPAVGRLAAKIRSLSSAESAR